MRLTIEERSVIAAFGGGDRAALAAELRASFADLETTDMRELVLSVAAKLDSMTDAEFGALDLTPEFDFDPDDDEETEESADDE